MLRRILVANRGEIAARIVVACQRLGIETVLAASEADLDSRPARLADRTICLGPPPPAASYLNVAAVIAAAAATGCQAIHPGYGFLAENPALARACAAAGLVFIGPAAATLELAGDKLAAREQAAGAGLPVLPGGEAVSAAQAQSLAADIGWPVLIKAAGGGGGRGLRVVHSPAGLAAAAGQAAAEARAAFGDPRIYIERFLPAARHVEVQLLGDGERVVQLSDRDCSIQRRYQKVVEEAPAPALGAATRDAIRDAAVRFARAIGYQNLGTVEFVVDSDTGEAYFLEVNCRIQVEHPVTEAVTGRDLVALQLRIADGEPLGFTQGDVALDGHAVECRLNAEDVAHGFMPSPGTLSLFAVPDSPRLRVDTHLFPGAVIPPYYDSLMAKLIVHAGDRGAAIDVLLDALEDVDVEGVETNRTLLISVLGHDDFRRGAVTTDWLERAIV